MFTQTFISSVIQSAKDNDNFEQLREQVPLGVDMADNVVTAQKYNGAIAWKHICVTGSMRVECICHLLIALSCFYERDEANFIILSPRLKYAELLGLRNMNAVVPYIRTKEDLKNIKLSLRDLLYMQMQNKRSPKLFLVLDGLDELPDGDKQELKEYNDILQSLMRVPNVQVISGVNLMKSLYSGCPGAFVGIGNCLVTTREDGKADVTYVGNDTNLSLPILIKFPCQPSVRDIIATINGASLEDEKQAEKQTQKISSAQNEKDEWETIDNILNEVDENLKNVLGDILGDTPSNTLSDTPSGVSGDNASGVPSDTSGDAE